MRKVFGMIGAVAGGWVGWFLGAPGGMFVAFLLGIVGTGVGVYYGHRLASRYS